MRRSPCSVLAFTVSCAEKSNRLDIRTSFYVFSRINQSLAKQEAPRKARHTGTGAYYVSATPCRRAEVRSGAQVMVSKPRNVMPKPKGLLTTAHRRNPLSRSHLSVRVSRQKSNALLRAQHARACPRFAPPSPLPILARTPHPAAHSFPWDWELQCKPQPVGQRPRRPAMGPPHSPALTASGWLALFGLRF